MISDWGMFDCSKSLLFGGSSVVFGFDEILLLICALLTNPGDLIAERYYI